MPSVSFKEPNPKRLKTSPTPEPQSSSSRSISSSLRLTLPKHPLKIKPSGNLLISTDEELSKINQSMGLIFSRLSDELILKIVGYLDTKQDLCNLMSTSKFFYGFLSFDDIWKSLYLNHLSKLPENEITNWKGSWKKSILKIDSTETVNCDLVYSDLIYIPYQNSQVNYQEIFKNVIAQEKHYIKSTPSNLTAVSDFPKGRIPRLPESSMDPKLFSSKWHDHPFILTPDSPTRWPKWDTEYLVKRFPNVTFRQECVEWRLDLYSQYSKRNLDENPLYLFDCNSTAMQELKSEFSKPVAFQTDYFDIFTNSCRPDNTWLITGPERSGSTFHKDPNNTSAWNTILSGSKLWILMPGNMKPPGVHTDEQEFEVTSPLGLAEWVLSGFYNDTVKISEGAVNEDGLSVVIGVAFEHECVYVPSGWWHAVINLEDTVALTGNFVPNVKLGRVLEFFKNRKEQISGFHGLKFTKFLKEKMRKGEVKGEIFDDFIRKTALKGESLLNDEDVGELDCGVELPVYELFVELMKLNGFSAELEKGLEDMRNTERAAKEGQVKRSELWEKLTEEKTGGFSFGFGFGSDYDDDDNNNE